MRKLLIIAVVFCTMFSCLGIIYANAEKVQLTADSKKTDFLGKKIASTTGTIFDKLLNENIGKGIEHMYFNDLPSQLEAVRSGKADAVGLDEPVARMVVGQNPDLIIVKQKVMDDEYGLAFKKGSQLAVAANKVVEKFKSDGTLAKMSDKWFSADENAKVLPELTYKTDFNGKSGVLKFDHDPTVPPMCYLNANGQSTGFEVELAMRIAYELNMTLENNMNSFGSLIPALASSKTDMVSGCISITEERRKLVDFVPYYKGGIVLVIKNNSSGATAVQTSDTGFIVSLKESFHRTFIVESRYKLIFQGIWVTILISFSSAVLGTLLGFIVCLMRRSDKNFLNIPAKIFIRIVQGTPLLVMLMIFYYVIFGKVNIDAVWVAIIAFSINFAAYVSEMMRTGINAVDKGQIEAAKALGFNNFQVYQKIIIPQAARYVLPVFNGEFISMVKMTSIVGYIAIQDLTKISDIIRSRTYEAFFPLIATAVIYLLIAHVFTWLLHFIEVKIDPKQRKRMVKGAAL